MKTKLYVAGMAGAVLLAAFYMPYFLFSTESMSIPSPQETKPAGSFVEFNDKTEIPGLQIKTPAKMAVVNKLAVAANRRTAEQKQLLDNQLARRRSSGEITAATTPRIQPVRGQKLQTSEAAPQIRSVSPSAKLAPELIARQPVVTKPSRIVENFATREIAVTTSNASTGNKFPHDEESRFPHDNEEETLVAEDAPVTAAAEETVVSTVEEKKVEEKYYAFRGKAAVRSDLYKYIPPFWDGFSQELGEESVDKETLLRKARQLAAMAKKNGYNTDIAFLADMSVKSNKNRFFIIDLKTLRIEKTALLAQGRGSERLNLDKDYSNLPGSNLSSLGIYKVGKSYNGAFGHSYRLYGLESTNNKAYQRAIVLHAMGTIPDTETNFPIWQSEGCPSVSPTMLEKLGNLIDKSSKPILFWMYDENFIPMG